MNTPASTGRTSVDPAAAERASLADALEAIREQMAAVEAAFGERLAALPPERRGAARNLLHYLVLRSRELRPLQDRLAALGLSSLGRAEHDVVATVDAIIGWLRHGEPGRAGTGETIDPFAGESAARAEHLLGPAPEGHRARIMVTMPSEAATDSNLVRDLVRSGMNIARINCAHDEVGAWEGMVANLRAVAAEDGKPCLVAMDLGGPKLRIGPLEQVPGVFKVRPERDAYGKVLRPARAWLTAREAPAAPPAPANAALEVDAGWLRRLRSGDKLRLRDARGRKRRWRAAEVALGGAWAEGRRTAYLVGETRLGHRCEEDDAWHWSDIRPPPPRDAEITVSIGERVMITRGTERGRPARRDARGAMLEPARVPLAIPEVFEAARTGEAVSFDDGIVRGRLGRVSPDALEAVITHTRKPVERLESGKGVNFPETSMDLPALTRGDLDDLDFVAAHADIVSLSFTNGPEDLHMLEAALRERGADDIGIVLKIETNEGFRRLPEILLAAQQWPRAGVMIARGDLAVECGFARMAEVQQEILWLCEAARIPAIWATQVLEGLAKSGHASRAEITDAAMGQSADCVMLNKGAHVVEAVRTLDDILRRMQGHHRRKRSMLRELRIASRFLGSLHSAPPEV